MRNYGDIMSRVEGLNRPHLHRRVLGEAAGFPVFGITLGDGGERPAMLVIGGTHGDEPAGVEAALAFLEDTRVPDALRFEVIPCLNPYGYVHNTRHNRQDADINWSFLREDVPEAGIVRRLVEDRRFEAFIDLHEDWESPGYYLYELRRGGSPVGPGLVNRLSGVCPVNTSPCIEGAEARAGVISPDLDAEVMRRGEGLPIALFLRHTDHLITSETPSGQPMGSRVQAHLIALETVIEAHAKRQG